MQTLQATVMCKRYFLIFVFAWVRGIQLMRLQEHTKFHNVKNEALKYLRLHKISADTQIQVAYDLQETARANDMHKHYNSFMGTDAQQCSCVFTFSLRLVEDLERSPSLRLALHQFVRVRAVCCTCEWCTI